MNELLRMIRNASIALCIASSLSAQQVPAWRLVEEWRVGGDITGAAAFGRVVAIRALPGGGVVVVEGKDQQIHIFDARGEVIKTVGRRGGGPGEFQQASGVIVSTKGEIVVNDSRNARLTFLSPTGELIRTQPNPPWGNTNAWDAYFDGQGRLVEYDRERRRMGTADFSRSEQSTHAPCANIPIASDADLYYRIYYPNGSYMGTSYPLTIAGRGAVNGADGFRWIGESPDYRRIHRVAFGSCAATVTVALTGPLIPTPGYERIRSMIATSARGQTSPDAPNPDKIRKTLPAFESLTIDLANRLWVERLVPGNIVLDTVFAVPRGSRRFEVFAPSGEPIAIVAAPAGLWTPRLNGPVAISTDRVFAFVRDTDDIPYLVSYRIVR